MYNKKIGFTLAEVLITLLIVGIIMAMSVPVVVSVKNSYTQSTYYVFNSLQAMLTKMMSGSPHPYKIPGEDLTLGFGITDIKVKKLDDKGNDKPVTLQETTNDASGHIRTVGLLFNCKTKADIASNITSKNLTLIRGVSVPGAVEFPGYDSDGNVLEYFCSDYQSVANAQSTMFCEALAGLANTGKKSRGAIHCDVGDLKTVTSSGSGEPKINIAGNPNFISNNGYYYYVSRWQKFSADDEYGYRLVAVDLNGARTPNITEPNNRQFPDIVTFIVWDTGAVMPLGVAADDLFSSDNKKRTRYLPSDVFGFDFDATADETNIPHECTGPGKLAPDGCKYTRIALDYTSSPRAINGIYKYTYREAYCTAFYSREDDPNYIGIHPSSFDYCATVRSSLPHAGSCPKVGGSGDGTHSLCTVVPIKPAFKFNLD